jgi:Cu+-exporting ATPase
VDADTIAGAETVDLDVLGMTCSSCANRIERKLNKMDGVEATVNYATEKAHVQFAPGITLEDVLKTVHDAGYEGSGHSGLGRRPNPGGGRRRCRGG